MQKLTNYMLPAAIIVGALAHSWLHQIAFLMPGLLFLMLLFTFAKIAPNDVKFKSLHLILLFIQLAGSLALYLILKSWNPEIAEALLICVLAPSATAAAVITGLLGGNVGFLTTYILASNLMISAAAPILFSYIGANQDLPFWESAWTICRQVMPVLILPLLLSWLIRWLAPKLQRQMVKMSKVPLYLWAVSLTIVTGRTVHMLIEQPERNHFIEFTIAILTLIVCLLQFFVGRKLGRRHGDPVSAGQALMQKNTVLAIWMSNIYLSPAASLGPAAYILWQNVINSYQLWKKGKIS